MHLMAALLEDKEGVVLPVLEKVGVPVQQLLAQVNGAMAKLPKVQGASQQPGMGAALQQGAGRRLQGSGELQGRVCFDRAPAAGSGGAKR